KSQNFRPLLLLVGAGEEFEKMSGIHGAVDPDQRTRVTIIVKAAEQDAAKDKHFRFRVELGNETKPDAGSFEFKHDFPLLKDQKLADVLTIDVQSGLYKIGTPLRLGSVRLDSKQPLTLHVRWPDAKE